MKIIKIALMIFVCLNTSIANKAQQDINTKTSQVVNRANQAAKIYKTIATTEEKFHQLEEAYKTVSNMPDRHSADYTVFNKSREEFLMIYNKNEALARQWLETEKELKARKMKAKDIVSKFMQISDEYIESVDRMIPVANIFYAVMNVFITHRQALEKSHATQEYKAYKNAWAKTRTTQEHKFCLAAEKHKIEMTMLVRNPPVGTGYEEKQKAIENKHKAEQDFIIADTRYKSTKEYKAYMQAKERYEQTKEYKAIDYKTFMKIAENTFLSTAAITIGINKNDCE